MATPSFDGITSIGVEETSIEHHQSKKSGLSCERTKYMAKGGSQKH